MSNYLVDELAIMSVANLIESGKSIPNDPAVTKYVPKARERLRIKERLGLSKRMLDRK